MEIRELRSFAAAARLRSISKAAELLEIGQPTVTTHIKKLETELGMVLFDRVRRPILLTLAGSTLAELVVPLLEGIDKLAARTVEGEEDGPVSVGSTFDIIPHTLLQVVRTFRSNHPRVHLRIRSGFRAEVLQMLRDGEVDLGIVPGHEWEPDIEFEGLFGYERVLIAPLGHPVLDEQLMSLEQIAKYPLIQMGRGTHTRAMLEAEFQRRGVPYDIVMELDSMDMIKRYVSLEMGVSVGPRLAIDIEDSERLGIVSMATLLPVEQAGIVTMSGKTLSTPALNFINVVREMLGQHATG